MSVSNYIPISIDIASINTNNYIQNIFLPATSSIYGKTISIKDITGNALVNNIIIRTQGVDRFQESDYASNYIINKNFGIASFFAKSNVWYLMNDSSQVTSNLVVNSVTAAYYYGDGSALSNTGFGISSLSSIVAYGLSSIYSPTGVSSLSSIVAYGLSTVSGGEGISSLSSIVAYGLSTVSGGEGVSSLSSIVAYGLSTVSGGEGVSSLSSIVAYGLSSVSGGEGVSSLSSIVAYGLSTLERQPAPGVSSLSSIVAYGLSSVSGGEGVSSLSSIVAYGLSTLEMQPAPGVSSLSSIVAYGLSSVSGGEGVSSLSSIVAYGLSTLERQPAPGVSSLSSIVAYGLSTVVGGHGISSLSSIVAYGLSTLQRQPAPGVSSLSSIVAYGLSSVAGGHGVSSLSSIVSYGLSSVAGGHGVSSLSSIVSYGLSSVAGGRGISSLSSIVSYGLSSIAASDGISSLSSIIAYGLSSIKSNIEHVQLLIGESSGIVGSNTWVTGFYPSSIGGADIYDASREDPDSVTNALAKLDGWIYKNIVDQPTVPSYFGKSNSISSINYYWSNPKQFKIGILNIFLPYISSLHMNLYSNTNLFSTFMYSDPYIPNAGFTVEGVDFISTDSNNDINVFKNPSFGNKNTILIPIDSKDFNIKNGPYSLELYFRNFSSNSYKILDFGSNNLRSVGFPGQPDNISFTNISLSNAFIEIIKPSLHSVDPEVYNYPPLNNYQVTLCNIAPSRRYTETTGFTPNIIFEESNYPYVAPLQSNSLGNTLLPDSTYIATVKVRNIVNSNYSEPKLSLSFKTLLPVAPGTLTSITPLSNGFSNTQIVFRNISNVVVYNRNTFGVGDGLQFTTNSGLGIHSSSNPGSNGVNIASISLIVTGPTGAVDSNTLNLDGFPIVSATTSNSNANTIVQASNIRDFHSGNIIQSNFFMSFTANAILRQSYLTASSNSYTFSMRHSNSGFNCNFSYSPSFYIDDLAPGAPSLISINNTLNSQSNWVSGVPAYSYSTYLAFNNDLSNLARFFYINNQNLLTGGLRFNNLDLIGTFFTCNIDTPLHTTTDILQSNAPLSNVTRIKTEITLPNNFNIFTPANITGERISVSLTFSNFFGSAINNISLPFYIDGPSEYVLNNIINSVTSPRGIRVESDGGSNNNLIAGTYLNTQLILGNTGGTINYNFELPLVNGLFRTGGALSNLYNSFTGFQVPTGIDANTYTNLTNYNTISGETTNRFATFRFDLTNSTGRLINNFTLTLLNQSGLILTNSTYNSLAVPYFYYRVDGVPGYNTGWLNANMLRSNANIFTNGISNVGGIREDVDVSLNSRGLAIVPIPNNCNYSIYVKIGLRMNCNISFQNFSITPNINSLPPAPANVVLTCNISITGSARLNLAWNTPTACNPPLIFYNFSIIPEVATINDTQYPRRFGGSIIQEPYFLNQNCNLPTPLVQTSFSFSNIASNYDTPYYGKVALANDSGLGPYSTTGYIITALPSNTGTEFNRTLRPSGTSVNYLYGGILFANRSGGNVANTLIYASNTLFTNNISRQFITNSNITVNPQDGYIGFKNNRTVWEIELFNVTSNQSLRSISYTFPNTLFGSSSQNISNADSDGTLFLLSNVQDMYSNDIYKNRFYLVATPVITLSNTRIPPSSNFYRLSLTDSSRDITNSLEFYVDNLVGAPSGKLDVENIGGISFCNISGVSVITSTTFNFWITTSNIGSFFFYNPPVTASITNMNATFAFNSGSTLFYWSNITGATYTQSPISNITYFYWPNISVTNSNFGTSYPLTGTVNNITNINIPLVGSFTPYFDFESIAIMNCNIRVESGGTIDNYPVSGTFGNPYNNNISVATDINYRFELQLSKGAYRSAPKNILSDCFLDYRNYFRPSSTLAIDRTDYSASFNPNTFRFVTFKHTFSNLNTSNKVNLLSINLIWANPIPTVITNNYDSGQFNFFIRFNSNIPTEFNDSSEWLNVQFNSSPFRTIQTKNQSLTNLGVASNVLNLVTNNNPRYSIAVPDGCGYGTFDVYTRVGLSTGYNGGYALSNIIVNISNEVNVTNLFTFNCNISGINTTISFITPFGLPSNTYYRLSNILYKRIGSIFEVQETSNIFMSPINNSNILTIQNVNRGTFSNNTSIYSLTNNLVWTGSYIFVNGSVTPPAIGNSGHFGYNGGPSYTIRVFLSTLPDNSDPPPEIRTFYYWSRDIVRGPFKFWAGSTFGYFDTSFNDLSLGNSGGNKQVNIYNSNTNTGESSTIIIVNVTIPTFRDPDPTPPTAPTVQSRGFQTYNGGPNYILEIEITATPSGAVTYYQWGDEVNFTSATIASGQKLQKSYSDLSLENSGGSKTFIAYNSANGLDSAQLSTTVDRPTFSDPGPAAPTAPAVESKGFQNTYDGGPNYTLEIEISATPSGTTTFYKWGDEGSFTSATINSTQTLTKNYTDLTDVNSGGNKTFTAYNQNNTGGRQSSQTIVNVTRPNYLLPRATAPILGAITFTSTNVPFTAECVLTRNYNNTTGNTYFTWSLTTGTTSSSSRSNSPVTLQLLNQNVASGTVYSITAYNRNISGFRQSLDASASSTFTTVPVPTFTFNQYAYTAGNSFFSIGINFITGPVGTTLRTTIIWPDFTDTGYLHASGQSPGEIYRTYTNFSTPDTNNTTTVRIYNVDNVTGRESTRVPTVITNPVYEPPAAPDQPSVVSTRNIYNNGASYILEIEIRATPSGAVTFYKWEDEGSFTSATIASGQKLQKTYSDLSPQDRGGSKTFIAYNRANGVNSPELSTTVDRPANFTPTPASPAPAPSFGKIAFTAVQANGSFTASVSLTRGGAFTTTYTWTPSGGGGSRSTDTTISINLNTGSVANGTSFNISGTNIGNGFSRSPSGSGTSSIIRYQTGSIPAGGETALTKPTGVTNYQVVLVLNANLFRIAVDNATTVIIRATGGNRNQSGTYIESWYV